MRVAKFDKVAIGEITIKLMEEPNVVSAKAAFVNTKSGTTHGYTYCTNWSKEVLIKIKELAALMSLELDSTHFDMGITSSEQGVIPQEIGGLGEFIKDNEIPQG